MAFSRQEKMMIKNLEQRFSFLSSRIFSSIEVEDLSEVKVSNTLSAPIGFREDNHQKDVLQSFQEPQVDVMGTMIDADIYGYFGAISGYIDLLGAIDLFDEDDEEYKDIQDDIEDAGEIVVYSQTTTVPNLEVKFTRYLQNMLQKE